MRTRIVKIGNSMGVRIPQPALGESGLQGDVELRAERGRIVITAPLRPRAGWAEAFAQRGDHGDDEAAWPAGSARSTWDDDEWQW